MEFSESQLSRQFRSRNLSSTKVFFLPENLPKAKHWRLIVVYGTKRNGWTWEKIALYDSLSGSLCDLKGAASLLLSHPYVLELATKVVYRLERVLHPAKSEQAVRLSLVHKSVPTPHVVAITPQDNHVDCGVYVCILAKYLLHLPSRGKDDADVSTINNLVAPSKRREFRAHLYDMLRPKE